MLKSLLSCGVLRTRRFWVVVVLLVAMAPWMCGCYGNFPLTNAVYKFNGEISKDRTVRTVAFWAMVIVPIYQVATLGDALVFNLVEFWTGKPLDVKTTSVDRDGNTTVLAPAENGIDAILTVSRDGQVLSQDRFVRVSDTVFEVRDVKGNLEGKVVRSGNGDILLTDARGEAVGALSSESVAALHAESR